MLGIALCRVLFKSGSMNSVWGHTGQIAKFSILRLSKHAKGGGGDTPPVSI